MNSKLIEQLHQGEALILDFRQAPWNGLNNPFNVQTMLMAPMTLGTRLLGVLVLDYEELNHHYTVQEIALTQAVTQLLTLVIEHEHLRQSNVQLTELISQAHDAILMRTPDDQITFWNQGAERLYGWSTQEALGQNALTLLQTRFSTSQEAVKNTLAEQEQWEGELTHIHREGKTVTVESRQVLLRDEQQRPSAILEINRDISERVHLQAERAEAQANEEAARGAESLMDEFIGVAGHELRTPLTTIKASIQMARRQLARTLKPQTTLPAEIEQNLRLALVSLERAERQIGVQNRLVSDLLEMSRIRANRLELFMNECDLKKVVKEVVEDQHFLEPARIITLDLPESEQVLVCGDEDRLRQVVNNYLSNALKYSPANTPIQVRLDLRGETAWVAVTDQGPGISREEQQQIWIRFYRVTEKQINTSASVAGLGLGLYICRTFIERQGGQVGVESQPGHGSTFWFSLPLAKRKPADS